MKSIVVVVSMLLYSGSLFCLPVFLQFAPIQPNTLLLKPILRKPNTNAIFVRQNTTGNNHDGTSWEHAFLSLQEALFIAESGDMIWVAKGTYIPSDLTGREASFRIPKGVKIYGGFEGNENTLNARNIAQNQTILSGDTGIPGVDTDNCYHVVYMFNTDSTTLLDGFTITEGRADALDLPEENQMGGGLLVNTDQVYMTARPTIRNCTFVMNKAIYGGGLCCNGGEDRRANPIIENCSFMRNFALRYGGGIYHSGNPPSINMPWSLLSCSFEQNWAKFSGGGICLIDPFGPIVVKNCSFLKDTAKFSDGGGIYWEAVNNEGKMDIIDCQFNENTSTEGGAFEFNYSGYLEKNNYKIKIERTVFEKNLTIHSNGGAINFFVGSKMVEISIDKSVFRNNKAWSAGGAYNIVSTGGSESHTTISNSLFDGNYALSPAAGAINISGDANAMGNIVKQRIDVLNSVFTSNRGVLGLFSGQPGVAEANIVNCTFYKNGHYPIVKNWSPDFDSVNFYSIVNIYNSILQEFTPIETMFNNNSSVNFSNYNYHIYNSLVNAKNCVVNGNDACSGNMLYEVDPLFADTVEHDLHLRACSPAINQGINNVVDTFELNTDFGGGPRILQNKIDLGAYERLYGLFGATSVTPASSPTASDGHIEISNIVGGVPPYQFYWSTGDSTQMLQNLQPGAYWVSVSDQGGCVLLDTFEVTFTSGVVPLLDVFHSLHIMPNPANEMITATCIIPDFTGGYFQILDQMGRLIVSEQLGRGDMFHEKISVAALPSGIYSYRVVGYSGFIFGSGKLVKR
jgi:hypothetical protein